MRRRTLGEGIQFGLLLQLAVGPVCLFVLRSAAEQGVAAGLAAVAAVILVDSAYVLLAALGVTRWAESGRVRRLLQYGGALVIAVFAVDVLVSVGGRHLLSAFAIRWLAGDGSGPFMAALLLTASNPLTIVFWAGVFGAKVAAERYGKKDVWLFSLGCVVATIIFLAIVAVAGAAVGQFLSTVALKVVNVIVGCALLYFAVRLALRRPPEQRVGGA